MIRIYCERDYLTGYEKIKYARAISVVIKVLKEFQAAINKEKEIEVNHSIIMK